MLPSREVVESIVLICKVVVRDLYFILVSIDLDLLLLSFFLLFLREVFVAISVNLAFSLVFSVI